MAKKFTFTNEQILKAAAVIVIDAEDSDNPLASGQPLAQYLRTLLETLWRECEEFSGKRPYGNSGWQYDVYKALIQADLVKGSIDKDGYVNDVDNEQADALVIAVIQRLVIKA